MQTTQSQLHALLQHTYFDSIVQGNEGALRAEVVGVTDKRMRFFGWLELTGGKISKYIVGPEPGDQANTDPSKLNP